MNISYYSLLAEILRKAQNRTCVETGKNIDVGNECRLLRAYIDDLRDALEEAEAALIITLAFRSPMQPNVNDACQLALDIVRSALNKPERPPPHQKNDRPYEDSIVIVDTPRR